jgi:hypothetical protein
MMSSRHSLEDDEMDIPSEKSDDINARHETKANKSKDKAVPRVSNSELSNLENERKLEDNKAEVEMDKIEQEFSARLQS